MPLWKLAVALFLVRRTSRRYLQTSSHDRSALAKPSFRSASSLPLERGHRCPFPLRTSASVAPAHFGMDCSESGTNDTRRLFGVLAAPLQMERRAQEQCCVHHELFPDRPRETDVRESEEPQRPPPLSPHNPTSRGSRIRERRKGLAPQLPAVSHR